MYYGIKKGEGRILSHARKVESGQNITDREVAKRALLAWIDGLTAPKRCEGAMPTLGEVLGRFAETKSSKTIETQRLAQWVLASLKTERKSKVDAPVSSIRTSEIGTVLARFVIRLQPN